MPTPIAYWAGVLAVGSVAAAASGRLARVVGAGVVVAAGAVLAVGALAAVAAAGAACVVAVAMAGPIGPRGRGQRAPGLRRGERCLDASWSRTLDPRAPLDSIAAGGGGATV